MRHNAEVVEILIADDHPIFRDGVRKLLEAEPDFRVVGEAADGQEAVRLAQQLRPHVALVDLSMPRMNGLEALRGLAASAPSVHSVLLTVSIEPAQTMEALQHGARGVILKESATQLLFKCIRCVAAGQYWLGRDGVADLVEFVRSNTVAGGREGRDRFLGLTPRELEIVAAIVAGDANKDIAQRLSISQQTVKHHLTSVYDKLGVSNRLELALLAIERRLVSNPTH